jgi:predicted MFS family arabinose efflux permease
MTLCLFVVGQGENAGTSVYLERVGGTATLAGIGAVCFSMAGAVSRLLCGPIVDSHGRRMVMMAGGLTLMLGTLAPVIINTGVFFLIWRVIQGAGFAIATAATATAAADVLPKARLGEGIGYYGLGQALAMSIGPALALFLVSTDPAQSLYLGLACFVLVACVLIVLCRYEKHPEKLPETSAYRIRSQQESTKKDTSCEAVQKADDVKVSSAPKSKKLSKLNSFFEPAALPGAIPILIVSPAVGFSVYFMGLYGTDLGYGSAGLYYTLSAVTMLIIRLKSGAFMDSVAPIKIMTTSVVFGIVTFAMLLSCPFLSSGLGQALFLIAGLTYGVFLGLVMPINQAIALKNTSPARWGVANALYLLSLDAGIGLSGLLWGVVNDTLGFSASICMVIAFIVASGFAAKVCYTRASAS